MDVIRNPAKYVARLGLAFSHTDPGLRVDSRWIQREPDVKGGRDPCGNPYCFSDGIGKISTSLIEMLQKIPVNVSIGVCRHFLSISTSIVFQIVKTFT